MLFVSYEEMKEDLASVITKLGKFLDKAIEGDMLEKLLEAVHIDSMRKNRGVNKADEIKVSWTLPHGFVGAKQCIVNFMF